MVMLFDKFKDVFTSKIKEIFDHDKRDYKLDDVLGSIPEEEITNLPKTKDLSERLPETYFQGIVPACTAEGKTHVSRIQNIIDHETPRIYLDHKDLWKNMGHEWKSPAQGEKGDYLENALKAEAKFGIKGNDRYGSQMMFKVDGYGYKVFPKEKEEFINTIKYYISQEKAIYTFFRGNKQLRGEMTKGVVTSVLKNAEMTQGHAVCLAGYNEDSFIFVNSWKANRGSKSMFNISFDDYYKMRNAGMIGRRFWLTYDKKDRPLDQLFIDFAPEKGTEEFEAVTWAKKNGIVKGVDKGDGNFALEPHRPVTRLEMILMLNRLEKSRGKRKK